MCEYARAHGGPLTPWNVLEFEISFQEHLKLLENENFSLKFDQTHWNLLIFMVYFVHSMKNTKNHLKNIQTKVLKKVV